MEKTDSISVGVVEDDAVFIETLPKYIELFTGAKVSTVEWCGKFEHLDCFTPETTDVLVIDGLDGDWEKVVKFLVDKGFRQDQLIIYSAGKIYNKIKDVHFVEKPNGESLVAAIDAISRKRTID